MFYKPAVHRPALLVLYVPRARLARVVRLDFALFVLEDSRKEPSPCNAVRIILLLVGLAFQDYKDFFIFSPYLSLRLPFQFSFRVIDVPPRLVLPPQRTLVSILGTALEDNTRNEFYSCLSLRLWSVILVSTIP